MCSIGGQQLSSLYLKDMATFASLEDQLDLITKGAAEIVPLEALKERITKSIATGYADADQGGVRSYGAGSAPGAYGVAAQAEALSDVGSYGYFFDWGFNGVDRRSDRAKCDAGSR